MGDMERVEKMFGQIDANMKSINQKLDSVMQEIKHMKEDNKRLKERVDEQEERINNLEREVRKKNLIIRGITDEEGEKESDTGDKVNVIMQKIGVNFDPKDDMDEVRRIGKFNPQKKRPVLIKLTREATRARILKSAKVLKGTEIWIDEDYPKDVQEERRRLIPRMKEAREKGYRAQLRYNKLIVNGGVYRADEMEKERETAGGHGNGSSSLKRTVYERSPEGDKVVDQLRKLTRTDQKN